MPSGRVFCGALADYEANLAAINVELQGGALYGNSVGGIPGNTTSRLTMPRFCFVTVDQ
jgi:hypothetical protein